MADKGDELVNTGGVNESNSGSEVLIAGEDLISPQLQAERAIKAKLATAAEVMSKLLDMSPVDRFAPAADGGEPEAVERINTRMAELQWKIAQYVLDACMDRLPKPAADSGKQGRPIVLRTMDAGALQAELRKRLKAA